MDMGPVETTGVASSPEMTDQVTGSGEGRIDFPPAVSHERIDPTAWDDIFLVGDVHGCLRELELLLARLDPSPQDLVLFVGDLVRKGPDSSGVVDLIRSHQNLRSVRGNNEDKLLRGDAECELSRNGFSYLESLPICLSWSDGLVVHGGIDPRRPTEEQGVDSLLTMRSLPPGNGYDGPFWFESYTGPFRVFFGHTVLDEPFVSSHAVGLDTGCVYGGSLTAYDYRRNSFVSVRAREEYRPRADAKIVDPE